VNEFIENLYTPLETTSNYSGFVYLHTLKITAARAKPFPACCLHQPSPNNGFWQWRFFSFPRLSTLVTAACAELLSAVNLTTAPSLFSLPCRNQLNCQLSTDWIAPIAFFITPWRRLHRKNLSSIVAFVFVSSGPCLPSHCSETTVCLFSYCIATAVHSTI
jgi:hypothetical protein